jgi:hypothetical protein
VGGGGGGGGGGEGTIHKRHDDQTRGFVCFLLLGVGGSEEECLFKANSVYEVHCALSATPAWIKTRGMKGAGLIRIHRGATPRCVENFIRMLYYYHIFSHSVACAKALVLKRRRRCNAYFVPCSSSAHLPTIFNCVVPINEKNAGPMRALSPSLPPLTYRH